MPLALKGLVLRVLAAEDGCSNCCNVASPRVRRAAGKVVVAADSCYARLRKTPPARPAARRSCGSGRL